MLTALKNLNVENYTWRRGSQTPTVEK